MAAILNSVKVSKLDTKTHQIRYILIIIIIHLKVATLYFFHLKVQFIPASDRSVGKLQTIVKLIELGDII